MADQEFLASFAVDIDEAGVSRLQTILAENRELADSLAETFNAASGAIHSFAEDMGILPNFSAGYGITTEGMGGLGGLAVGLELSKAFSDYEAFTALVKQPISLKVNTSGITSAARSAMSSVRSIFAEPVDIRFRAETGGEESKSTGTTLKMSTGGRFSQPTDVQVAEDGDAEYIIPVKKEEKALPLLRQLLSELSPAARERLDNSELRIQNSELKSLGNLGWQGNTLTGGPLAGEVSTTIYQTHQNVSAPVSIQVHASGTDPEQIGQSLYSMTERYLQRTLESAFS
ncbi:hypothetical protein [Aristaeella hokkaidonensis]|uniref:Uncharacterized protein n=1 Tax=Aristaeella hokkaidonensis TaxID=3046382 RepID=A0AC61MX81_9FIRM|nr:hypothetical protein [Aristaeella hokkaidonensis]QUC66193.1 hypothetical protein JYE49_09965 [Aristaeella hokkaidonensis]SNT94799.1 hypothetical protein SAMN06297421_10727 [Aristaeella hokkaidonensis]